MTKLRSKADIELLLAPFWVTWSARNHFLFKGKRMHPQVLLAKAEAVIHAYKRTQVPTFTSVGNQQRLTPKTWSSPKRCF